ncbi:cytochrome c [Geomicrobium sp. JCM 19038]|uniref:c-type cytochrome n=1 Tax=Geomicrobium sp. JCM 19038 TaxID=1460635 RepID=UPI00045F3669|nr:cytochrome c [Geomicrobium sp. JCM 19038]GAK08011.1 cytochrome c551 [Geomicrobium sp. JCM 19038]
MKKLLMAIAGSTLLLAACSGEEAGESGETVDTAAGEEVYTASCLSCHGDNMEGASGPALEGYTADEVLSAIEEGPGAMPANIVEGEDAQIVAAYVEDES